MSLLELPKAQDTYEDRVPTKEEVRKMLEHVGLRERAMTLLMCSAGVRIGALHGFQFRDFEVKTGFVQVRVYGDSPGDTYFTYCTLEAWDAVEKYRLYRERYGETVTPDSLLLRDGFNANSPVGARNPKPMLPKSYRSFFSKKFKTAGLQKGYARRHDLHPHVFRKFFKTTLEMAGVPTLMAEILMGRIALIFYNAETGLYCEYCGKSECVHIDYAWTESDIAQALREHGLKSPEDLDAERRLKKQSQRD